MKHRDAIMDYLLHVKAASCLTLAAKIGVSKKTVYDSIKCLDRSGHIITAGFAPTPHIKGKSTVQLWALAPHPFAKPVPVIEPVPSADGITARAIASRPELQRIWL